MNKDRFAERMLETENLTDALEDADANWLLNWGTAKLDTALSGVQDDEAAGERANALMALMRKMNRIAGSYSEKSPEALAEDLAALRELAAAAFPQAKAAVEQPATRSGSRPLVEEPAEAAKPSASASGNDAGGASTVGEQRIRPAETGFRPLRSLVNWFRRWGPQADEKPEAVEPAAVEVKAEPVAQQPDPSAEAERLRAMSPSEVLKELSKLVGEG